jgi:hypothetical protein
MGFDSHPDAIVTEFKALANKLTTVDAYADVEAWAARFYLTKHLHFVAVTNNLLVQILASMDGGVTYPITAEAEFAVNPGTSVSKTITTYYTHLKVQVKPAVSATHGTLSTSVAGASF